MIAFEPVIMILRRPDALLHEQCHEMTQLLSMLVPVQVEVSLQPWLAFKPDGVILFSDILTPLSGMNIPFDIAGGEGPIIHSPIRTMDVSSVT